MNDVNLRVPSLIGKPGDIVTVPILISNATEQDVISDIVSLDLLLTYDPTLVSIVDPNPDTPENEAVRRAGISANWSIEGISNPVVNLEAPGTIDLALIKDPNSTPNTDSNTILEIDFTIAQDAALGSSTSIDLQANDQESRIGIGDQDSPIADESLQDGQIGVAELSIGDVSLAEGNEGNTQFNFTVSLSGGNPLAQAVTVDYATADDSAVAGEDYTATSDTLSFAPGETEKTITVDVIGDTTVEDDQTFLVNLSNFTGGAIADAQGVATITNDDGLEISINDDVSIAEGDEGNQELTFTVSLSNPSDQAVTVDYTTADDTAVAGEDYTAINGTLTFEAGETTKNISVQVSGDTNFESDETFFVNLSNPSRGAIADAQGVATITNDDVIEISIDDVEGNEGDTEFIFTVSLSNASNETVTVDYVTTDDTAIAGEDYTATSGTLTFEPGQPTTQPISVPILNDEDFEVDQAFNINLSNATNATISDPQGIGIIGNEEVDPLAPDDQGTIPGSLSLSDSDDSYIYKNERYFYDFYAVPVDGSISSDDTINITLTSNDFRPLLMILNSEGQVISVGESSNETTSTITSFDLPDSSFFLSIETFEANARGDYQLQIDII